MAMANYIIIAILYLFAVGLSYVFLCRDYDGLDKISLGYIAFTMPLSVILFIAILPLAFIGAGMGYIFGKIFGGKE